MNLNKIYIAIWNKGEFEPAGIVYFNRQNGIGGFQYLDSYSGPPIDPVNLDYRTSKRNPSGNRNFVVRANENPDLLHRVFRGFLPAKWGGSVMAAEYPIMKTMCDAEKLYFLGARTVGGMSSRVVGVKTDQEKPVVEVDVPMVMESSLAFYKKEIPKINLPNAKWGLASHGGARPKVSMIDESGGHWIVKFDLPVDGINAGRVEHALAVMARMVGIDIPDTRVITTNEGQEMFAIKRYDRDDNGRFFQTSMYSLMNSNLVRAMNDGDYKDMFDVLDVASNNPTDDKTELFRRMLFNVAVNNIDDHLENFSMILKDGNWQLSPAYDITLEPSGRIHTTSIFGMNEIDLHDDQLISRIASKVGVNPSDAISMRDSIVSVVQDWEPLFESLGVSQHDLELISGAFSSVTTKKKKRQLV